MAREHVWQGTCMAGGMHGSGHAWEEGICGGGHACQGVCMGGGHEWWGACMVGSVHGRGHAWQERQPLQWTVHILLECILVNENSLA